MSYLNEFESQIKNRDFSKFLVLWEEYCTNDSCDSEEYIAILKKTKTSDFAPLFGKYVEMGLPLWKLIEDKEASFQVIKLLFDLETTNSPELADLANHILEEKYGSDPLYKERIRLIGLRSGNSFQGCLASYELLAHMKEGKCVFHAGGWGTGEIMEVSAVREQVAVEFEYVEGQKHITFTNAFKTLIPLSDDNFLSRRFTRADDLEKEAKKEPIEIIKILLRDLGPKSAGEIKDELCDLVIPEPEWAKWWQTTRTKLKKETIIDVPATLKESFRLRKQELSHVERLEKEMNLGSEASEIILTSYNFVRDLPAMLKQDSVKNSLIEKIQSLLDAPETTKAQELQIYIFLEQIFNIQAANGKTALDIILTTENIPLILNDIEIVAFKKRALTLIRTHRTDWAELFLNLLDNVQQSQLRDYILGELNAPETRGALVEKLEELLLHPEKAPDLYVWYFQKVVGKGKEKLPFDDEEGIYKLYDGLLVLLNKIESDNEQRPLIKKIYGIIVNKRFENVRDVFQDSPLEFVKEFLLLASKCHTFNDHDIKTLKSLAQVSHPSLETTKKIKDRLLLDGRILWTTEEGYRRTQEKAQHLGSFEIIKNAQEVEAARALGDLRENSEYKYACEKRRQLQNELKTLSHELNRARIITPIDVDNDEVGIGNIVELINQKGEKITYSILGPWDADTEKNILSFQSKFAQSMGGLKLNEKFEFRGEEYTVISIKNLFE